MAVEAIKKVCEDNGWTFTYGAGEWLNLSDNPSEYRKPFEDRTIHGLLHNVVTTESYNDFGGLDSTSHRCSFMLGVTSDFNDPDYNHKWENNIKPLIDSKYSIFINAINGCDYKITGQLTRTEFSNLFDNNLDGFRMEFTLVSNG